MDRQARDELVERLQHENAAMLADVLARRERDLLFSDCAIVAPAVSKAVRSVAQLEEEHREAVALRQRSQQADVAALLDARLERLTDFLADELGTHTAIVLAPVLLRLVEVETELVRLRNVVEAGNNVTAIGSKGTKLHASVG